MKEPGPDHPIVITPHAGRVRILVGQTVVATTTNALSLKEASYPAVLYIPREDADWRLFARSQSTTHCPYKGEASYYELVVDGTARNAAVWTYENPFPAAAPIRNHLAFYPDRVDRIETD